MRIAQVSPLYESVPPKFYGGTERVVSYLTEQLVADGHEVTLYASGDSMTAAKLVPTGTQALRLNPSCGDALAHHYVMFEQLIRDRKNFDVVHFHTDYLHFPVARHLGIPHLTTLHGRLDLPELPMFYAEFSDMPVIGISNAQRAALPNARWLGTVHHGLPPDQYRFAEPKDGYLAFLGRVSPEKGLDRAIEIATRLEMRLRVAAKVDRADRDYYLRHIAPLLQSPYVEFIGEISDSEKNEFLGGARALLFPIDWPEPFGLVLIEAMACGTPVVAYRRGSVPELIVDGENGFLVDTIDQAVAAVKRLPKLSRARCREIFDERFTTQRMMEDYLSIYETLAGGDQRAAARLSRGGSLWKNSYTTSSTSSPPRVGLTNEPAF
jgi:glycosyltransferase involved in cell wall biosynthesis